MIVNKRIKRKYQGPCFRPLSCLLFNSKFKFKISQTQKRQLQTGIMGCLHYALRFVIAYKRGLRQISQLHSS